MKKKFELLNEESPAISHEEAGWNFEDFLLGKNEQALRRFKSSVEPSGNAITKAVETEIKENTPPGNQK